jgi:hypothetical protein
VVLLLRRAATAGDGGLAGTALALVQLSPTPATARAPVSPLGHRRPGNDHTGFCKFRGCQIYSEVSSPDDDDTRAGSSQGLAVGRQKQTRGCTLGRRDARRRPTSQSVRVGGRSSAARPHVRRCLPAPFSRGWHVSTSLASGMPAGAAAPGPRKFHGPRDNCDPRQLAAIPEAKTYHPTAEEFRCTLPPSPLLKRSKDCPPCERSACLVRRSARMCRHTRADTLCGLCAPPRSNWLPQTR